MSRVKSEKIPSFPGLEGAEPTCAVALLLHVEWIGCRVRFPQGWMQKDTRSPEVLSFFFFFYSPSTWMVQRYQVNSIRIQLHVILRCYKQGGILLTLGNFRGWATLWHCRGEKDD